jgi:K+-sensing histidine kinase KdpD
MDNASDNTMIEIPFEILQAANLSPKDIKAELAIQLYKQGRITIEQAHLLADESTLLKAWLEKKGWSGHIEMDEFISEAAHDLKSPMNAITGFTKVVIKGIDGPVNETQVTDLNTAFQAGQRMLALLNNLIDMARLNNGDINIDMSRGDLAQVITDACTRWKTQNSTKELQTEIQIGTPGIMLDSARMRQAVIGLLTYAGNHVADSGKLTLRAQDNDEMFSIQIESAGEKPRDKFEMDLTMLAYICRGLIERHGGQLELGEDTGSGIALNFSLPKT